MSAAAPSDVTGICGTGYYISVSVLCCTCELRMLSWECVLPGSVSTCYLRMLP